MAQIKLSQANERYLRQLVESGQFPNPAAVLREAMDYLRAEYSLSQSAQIDLLPADNGNIHTQDQWIQFFNEHNQQMISAPDAYIAGRESSRKLLRSLQEDFDASWLVSSTRIDCSQNDLSARLTHNFGSTVTVPKETTLVIPVYQGIFLPEVLGEEQGITYLRNLFDTKDSPRKITSALENLADKNADEIKVWTPTQESRRAAEFGFDDGQFLVYGSYLLNNYGRSLRVSVSPRSGPQK